MSIPEDNDWFLEQSRTLDRAELERQMHHEIMHPTPGAKRFATIATAITLTLMLGILVAGGVRIIWELWP